MHLRHHCGSSRIQQAPVHGFVGQPVHCVQSSRPLGRQQPRQQRQRVQELFGSTMPLAMGLSSRAAGRLGSRPASTAAVCPHRVALAPCRTAHGGRRGSQNGLLQPRAAMMPSSKPIVRELPTKVAETFYVVQDPALFNTSYSEALLRFVDAAILAYECGMNEDSLRYELKVYKASLEQQVAPPGMALNEDGCMLGAKIVWLTLMETRSVRRWAAYNPVTDNTIRDWAGFVAMIVDGYVNRRLAWFPIERLQMELLAVQDLAAAPHDVSEWARIVYTVLEAVAPQLPGDGGSGRGDAQHEGPQ